MQSDLKNITIIGAGAWGLALASLVKTNNHHVKIWSRQSPQPLCELVKESDAIISAVSIKGVRSIAEQLQIAQKNGQLLP
ncbi:MAG: glycerol-3-phosphate dehydrogenase, partial [Pseudanabaena sp.]